MPSLVGWVISGLAWLFRSRIGTWIASALAWFGLSWATYEFAVDPWLDNMKNYTHSPGGAGEWGSVLVAYLGIMRFDVACTMIASAVAAKFTVSAAKAFLVKKG